MRLHGLNTHRPRGKLWTCVMMSVLSLGSTSCSMSSESGHARPTASTVAMAADIVPDPCDLTTDQEVGLAIGKPMIAKGPGTAPLAPFANRICTWGPQDSSPGLVTMQVYTNEGLSAARDSDRPALATDQLFATVDALFETQDGQSESLPAARNKWSSNGSTVRLFVIEGSSMLNIDFTDGAVGNHAHQAALADQVLERLRARVVPTTQG
jgi:hypothetical protein